MTKHTPPMEFRSAEPIETREDDPLAAATAAVEELRSASEQFRTETNERISTELNGITERLDEIDTRTQRPGTTQQRSDEQAELETRAFVAFMRRGAEALPETETRALIVADDTAGGFSAPAQFVTEVIKDIVEFSPVRQAARVGTTGSGSVILPKRTGRPAVKWTGETEESSETEPEYGQVEIPIHQATAYVDVSNTLLEDSQVNLEAELRADFAEELGRAEGEVFVNGNGVKRPQGFMQDADVAYTPNTHATTLKADALIDLLYAMPAAYRSRGAWMMNGTTLATARKLKDGQNNYLWQPSFQAGEPETILGRPVIEAPDMPDIASDAFPIAFGDFNRAYRIYDRVALNVMRDPYTQATKSMTRFHVRRRVGGGVVQAEALRKLKMSTS